MQPNKLNMNEIDYGRLKEIKMKHGQWSVDWRKCDEMWWNVNNEVWTEGNEININNEVDNVTLPN